VAVDPKVIRAIEQALASTPENIPLRLHLARLLADAGRPVDALAHCQSVLAAQPDSVEAIRLAAHAADAQGDTQRAQGYRRLLQSLTAPSAPEVLPNRPSAGVDPPTHTVAPSEEEARGLKPDPIVPLRVMGGERVADVAGDLERPRLRLADVGGMEAVKRRLEVSFLGPMRNPELRARFGKSLRGGLLLWGPPGCGKTFIARATAGELGAHFTAVGLSEVLDMWLGQSERNLHEIFEMARRHTPCVIFIDELDALGQKRTHLRHYAALRGVSAQLLAELDGTTTDNEGVFVLGATNAPWDIEPALKRPGRFDRSLLVLPPDAPAREAILHYHLRDRLLEDVSAAALAQLTDGYSGADLAHLCESAAELAMHRALLSNDVRGITQGDLLSARCDIGPSTTEWFATARNFAMFANAGGPYDELLTYMRERQLR
jgi:AAA+ superfamily predicted ATPase